MVAYRFFVRAKFALDKSSTTETEMAELILAVILVGAIPAVLLAVTVAVIRG